MRVIDLSHPIGEGMPVMPGDEPVRLFQTRFLEKHGYNGFRFDSGLHAGTHMDAPSHLTDSAAGIRQMTPERCIGRGCLVDVRGKQLITAADGMGADMQRGDMVLLYTGFDSVYGEERYYTQSPVVDVSFAHLLIEKGVSAFAMDIYSPDKHPFPVHTYLMARGMPIIENLTNLSALVGIEEFAVAAFPLALAAEASPVRVVAWEISALSLG